MNRKRVLVAMSGGIDSSAACLMLQEQGYEVLGVTMRTWDSPSKFSSPGQEYPDYIMDAKALADKLGIEHHVSDEREEFKNTIVKYFVDEYMQGRTPNPCALCNPLFKFRMLKEWADKLDCYYMATGHYSRLEERSGYTYIIAGDDVKKDQSYFLWRLGQDVLKRCVFPLGNYTKDKVREYLKEKGFEAKSKEGESMEVCFVEGDYRDFLREQLPEIDSIVGKGMFVNSEGVKLGEHKGFPYYTIGQRKGLEIALGYPAYVLKINAAKNTVMLGEVSKLETDYMLVEQQQLVSPEEIFSLDSLTVRIRYRSKPIPCSVRSLEDGRLLIHFRETASAITPGQSAVFYDGKRVLGGALIASQRGIGMWIEQ